MKFRDALNFSTRMVFVIMYARFFFVLILIKSINLSYCNSLMYPVIPHIDVLYPLVIPVILSQMYLTLTVIVDLN